MLWTVLARPRGRGARQNDSRPANLLRSNRCARLRVRRGKTWAKGRHHCVVNLLTLGCDQYGAITHHKDPSMLRRDILTCGALAAFVFASAPASAEDSKVSLFKVVTLKDE